MTEKLKEAKQCKCNKMFPARSPKILEQTTTTALKRKKVNCEKRSFHITITAIFANQDFFLSLKCKRKSK